MTCSRLTGRSGHATANPGPGWGPPGCSQVQFLGCLRVHGINLKVQNSTARQERADKGSIQEGYSGLVNDAGAFGEAGGDAGGDGGDGRRGAEGGCLGVDGVGIVGAKAQCLDGARVGHELGLPAVVGLVLLHGSFGGGVPRAVGIFGEIVLADKGGLNLGDALGIDSLLAVKALGFC